MASKWQKRDLSPGNVAPVCPPILYIMLPAIWVNTSRHQRSQPCRSLWEKSFQAKETASVNSLGRGHAWVKLFGHIGKEDSVVGRGEWGVG